MTCNFTFYWHFITFAYTYIVYFHQFNPSVTIFYFLLLAPPSTFLETPSTFLKKCYHISLFVRGGWKCAHVPWDVHVGVREQPSGVSSLLALCGSQRPGSAHQAGQSLYPLSNLGKPLFRSYPFPSISVDVHCISYCLLLT